MERNYLLSVVIITLNEARTIQQCIEAAQKVADEIIVLDSFSTDETPAICNKLGVQFVQREWQGYANAKNHLNSLTKFEYVLSIDADEIIDSELEEAILIEKKRGFSGIYAVQRKTNYLGKWILHSGWYPDVKNRLFPKSKATWVGEFVHEELEFPADLELTVLHGHLEHYSYFSFEDHRSRADKYSTLTAQRQHKAGKKAGFLKPYFSAISRFFGMYILKLGFLDGKMGFKIALISAQSNVFKYKELRRLNKMKSEK